MAKSQLSLKALLLHVVCVCVCVCVRANLQE